MNLAQKGAAEPSGKIFAPGDSSLGLKERILNSLFLIFGELRWAGARSALFSVLMSSKRWVRATHGRPNPTSGVRKDVF